MGPPQMCHFVEFDEDKKREIPKLLIGAYADLIYLVDVPIGALS